MDALGAMLAAGVAPPRAERPAAPPEGRAVDNAKAAREMEALFMAQLLKAMRKTVPETGLLSGGRGEEVMRSIQDEALAQALASRGGLGLAERLERSLDRIDPPPADGAAGKAEDAR